MSSFSFTAPQFTDKDELEEQSAVTAYELKQLRKDVYGGVKIGTLPTDLFRRRGGNDIDECSTLAPSEYDPDTVETHNIYITSYP